MINTQNNFYKLYNKVTSLQNKVDQLHWGGNHNAHHVSRLHLFLHYEKIVNKPELNNNCLIL